MFSTSDHRCHQNALYKVTWSPHRPNVIATASSDQMVNIWDVNNFQALATYTGHTRTVKTVKFHPTHPGKDQEACNCSFML
jgi:WD40 repeat protein